MSARGDDSIRSAMAELAATFATHTELATILEAVTRSAVRLIDDIDVADILVIDEDQHRSMAPTAPLATDLDSIQLKFGEGPCLDAISNQPLVHSTDLNAEQRWPRFAAAAVDAGVQSIMSFHLYSYPTNTRRGTGGRGALNLFSRNAVAFSLADQALGAMLATQAAVAIIAANRQIQFESALASRDLLGQAKGILMERFNVDAVRAFQLMVKRSQDTNTPVRTIAQRIVDTTDAN